MSLRLVENRACDETVAVLEELLSGAKRGEVVGVAYVAFCCGKERTSGAAGYAADDITQTVGALQRLSLNLIKTESE